MTSVARAGTITTVPSTTALTLAPAPVPTCSGTALPAGVDYVIEPLTVRTPATGGPLV